MLENKNETQRIEYKLNVIEPNIKIEDVDGNILFYRAYVKGIKPYYYNFRTNSHLKFKYLQEVDY